MVPGSEPLVGSLASRIFCGQRVAHHPDLASAPRGFSGLDAGLFVNVSLFLDWNYLESDTLLKKSPSADPELYRDSAPPVLGPRVAPL